MDYQIKDHTDPIVPAQGNRPNNLPNDDVENINSTNKGDIYYSLTSR